MSTNRLEIRGVSKRYPTRGPELVVLREIDLSLGPGAAVAIIGPSGSGKSTLLNILAALEPPTEGRVTLDGIDPFTLTEPELARFRNGRIGLIFQDHHLLPQCSALENVLIPTAPRGTSREAVQRARGILERVGFGDRLEHRPAELSGGERQRVAIARAMINQPALILADEPTGNLDLTTARTVADVLLDFQGDEGAILIVVTHSTELAARLPHTFELREGRLSAITATHAS